MKMMFGFAQNSLAPSRPYAWALVGAAMFWACNKQSTIDTGSRKPSCSQRLRESAQQSSTKTAPSSRQEQKKEVTFYRDLLPILEANVRGANYKCTVCHHEYKDPHSVANVPEVERIIASLEAGRMPRAGDRVPQDRIDLFKRWRLTGFTLGNPEDMKPLEPNANDLNGSADCEPRT